MHGKKHAAKSTEKGENRTSSDGPGEGSDGEHSIVQSINRSDVPMLRGLYVPISPHLNALMSWHQCVVLL